MLADEMIEQIQKIRKEHGNIEIVPMIYFTFDPLISAKITVIKVHTVSTVKEFEDHTEWEEQKQINLHISNVEDKR